MIDGEKEQRRDKRNRQRESQESERGKKYFEVDRQSVVSADRRKTESDHAILALMFKLRKTRYRASRRHVPNRNQKTNNQRNNTSTKATRIINRDYKKIAHTNSK